MPKKILPRLASVSPGKKPMTLRLHWQSGEENTVNVAGLIENFRMYKPLRQSGRLFQQVKLGEHGTDIIWPGGIDMAADTLWRLMQEQSGKTLSAVAFRRWRERKAYTLDEAAHVLGLSRRMVAYYEQGQKPIPRIVALATRGLEIV